MKSYLEFWNIDSLVFDNNDLSRLYVSQELQTKLDYIFQIFHHAGRIAWLSGKGSYHPSTVLKYLFATEWDNQVETVYLPLPSTNQQEDGFSISLGRYFNTRWNKRGQEGIEVFEYLDQLAQNGRKLVVMVDGMGETSPVLIEEILQFMDMQKLCDPVVSVVIASTSEPQTGSLHLSEPILKIGMPRIKEEEVEKIFSHYLTSFDIPLSTFNPSVMSFIYNYANGDLIKINSLAENLLMYLAMSSKRAASKNNALHIIDMLYGGSPDKHSDIADGGTEEVVFVDRGESVAEGKPVDGADNIKPLARAVKTEQKEEEAEEKQSSRSEFSTLFFKKSS